MRTLLRRPVAGSDDAPVVVAATERDDGDFHLLRVEPTVLAGRQRRANGRCWAMVEQVHGIAVHAVEPAPSADAIAAARAVRADVIAAARLDVPLAVCAADCAPLVLIGGGGAAVVAHCGWRGLAAGIVDVAFDELEARDATGVAAAVLGPVVHPCCYAFGADDLASVARGVGAPAEAITGRTAGGEPALDVPAAVAAALRAHGVVLDSVATCTACDRRWFSHRRGDAERHAVVVWREDGDPDG